MNDPELFPFYEPLLKIYAEKWASDAPEPVKRITLHRYQSKYGRALAKRGSLSLYMIVFELVREKPIAPESPDDRKKRLFSNNVKQRIYEYLDCFQTVDRNIFLLDDLFRDVYKNPPGDDFRNQWMLVTKGMVERNQNIPLTAGQWILYEAVETIPLEIETLYRNAKREMEVVFESIKKAGFGEPDSVLKRVALEAIHRDFKFVRPTYVRKIFSREYPLRAGKERRDFIGKMFQFIMSEHGFSIQNYQEFYAKISKIS